jgi:hypothetical protein
VRGASEFLGLEVMLTGNPPVAIKFKSVPLKIFETAVGVLFGVVKINWHTSFSGVKL